MTAEQIYALVNRKTGKITGEQICNYFSNYIFEYYGGFILPTNVWNSTPNGEIFPLIDLYDGCKGYPLFLELFGVGG